MLKRKICSRLTLLSTVGENCNSIFFFERTSYYKYYTVIKKIYINLSYSNSLLQNIFFSTKMTELYVKIVILRKRSLFLKDEKKSKKKLKRIRASRAVCVLREICANGTR